MKKLRKPLSLFLSFLMVISMVFGMSFNAYADETNCTYDESSHTLYVNGTGTLSELYTGMTDETWEDEIAPKITDLVIGEGITKIDTYLFGSYESLENVTLSSTVEEIGDNAFNGSPIKNINLDNVKIIGNSAFENTQLTSLEQIDLPNVERIGSYAFGYAHFKNLVLPNVKTIASYAFTSSYIETLVANKCETIGDYAFKGCYNLKSVETSAKVIGSNAFENCESLKDLTFSQVETIDTYAFNKCTSLTSVVIPNTVGEIGKSAFAQCSSLKYVEIEPGDKQYDLESTFDDCENLLIAIIPSNITSVNYFAFDNLARNKMYIITPQDSAAYKFAAEYSIKCAVLGSKLQVSFANCNEIENANYVAGDKYGKLPDSTKDIENQDFIGWKNEFGILVGEDDYVVPVDHTLTAVYRGNEYKITFDPNGGTLDDDGTRTVYYGEKVGALPNASKKGYTFDGWYDANGNKLEDDFVFQYKNSVTLTAHYTPIEYTLNLYTKVGKESKSVDSVRLKYDEEFTLPALDDYYMYNFKDHRFLGWQLNGTNTYYADGATVKNLIDPTATSNVAYLSATFLDYDELEIGQTKNIDLKSEGKYPAEHKLKFVVEKEQDYIITSSGGFLYYKLKNANGDVIGASSDTVNTFKLNNNLVASLAEGEYTIETKSKSVPSSFDITVLPTKTASVKFDADGGTVSKTEIQVATNGTFGTLPTPEKEGYNFGGWLDESGNTIRSTSVVPADAETITLKAKWNPIAYSFTYYNESGVKIKSQTFTYDVAQKLESADSLNVENAKPGYEFVGWATAANATTVSYTDCQTIYKLFTSSKSVALYPVYIQNDSRITIYFHVDGNVNSTQGAKNNTTVTLKTAASMNVSKLGYTFTGWAETSSGEVKYADAASITAVSSANTMDLYAVFTPITYDVQYYDADGELLSRRRYIKYDSEFTISEYASLKDDPDSKVMNLGWSTTKDSKSYEYKENTRYKNLASEQGAVVKLYPVLVDSEKFDVKYQLSPSLAVTDIGYYSQKNYSVKSPLDLCDYYTKDTVDKYFVGWSVDGFELTIPDFETGDKIASSDFAGADVTFYALWQTSFVSVTFDNELAGQSGNVKYLPVGNPVGKLDGNDFSDDDYDYEFVGWFTQRDGGEQVTEDYVISSDVKELTLYARYTLVPKPKTVKVTIKGSSLGQTFINNSRLVNALGDIVLDVKYGSIVDIKAIPYSNTDFIGWCVGGKMVSNNYSYSFEATQDITFEPVFEEIIDDDFTVVFIDMYGNVVSSQNVTDAEDIQIPRAPIYPGYKFDSWSMSESEIASLVEGATIRGNYKKDNSKTYTVKADGATITVGSKTYNNEASGISYDAKVTVTKAGTTSWRVNDSIVAYGESYTFFAASDIELVSYQDSSESVSTQISIVSTERPSSEAPDVLFIASRVIVNGETVIRQGFVYGMGVCEDDLTLENVGNTASAVGSKHGKVKVLYNKNGSNQIGLNYGVSSMHGLAGARAFVTTVDKNGNQKTTYSNASIYKY